MHILPIFLFARVKKKKKDTVEAPGVIPAPRLRCVLKKKSGEGGLF